MPQYQCLICGQMTDDDRSFSLGDPHIRHVNEGEKVICWRCFMRKMNQISGLCEQAMGIIESKWNIDPVSKKASKKSFMERITFRIHNALKSVV